MILVHKHKVISFLNIQICWICFMLTKRYSRYFTIGLDVLLDPGPHAPGPRPVGPHQQGVCCPGSHGLFFTAQHCVPCVYPPNRYATEPQQLAALILLLL
ncbi:hypothetical protein AVEN_17389-1 [Araneus ventricosus]|uniref:Uncharacterized protein n=1 Tax=Araneus ventricosus TaxID=182803 RepID=A0A4Y2H0X6_ARAVE|nr:hypothetical protein AVEN_17389-1 [Araneus ventricosus]